MWKNFIEVLRMILKRDECNCYSLQQLEVLMERCEDVLKGESQYYIMHSGI